ncbi:cadherin-related tumor suppressor-like [Tropilaelaps mercedesae]|uniref:Cadherin-related tumor suppressor-like n=1 Tax=Tropilaelaps mercedesae TaxID=418985 RepID=A0A1V9XD69_9ACAR|nr:cadherin-related tumor suppressor-like [Tropilaelaps mercedesae]
MFGWPTTPAPFSLGLLLNLAVSGSSSGNDDAVCANDEEDHIRGQPPHPSTVRRASMKPRPTNPSTPPPRLAVWTALVALALGSEAATTREVFEVKEGLPPGTSVGFIPLRANFTYRFNEPPREFELNATTGEIRTTAVLDREALPSERLDLVVLSSQPTYPIEVRIIVLDANDHAPQFPESSLAVSLSEASAVGTRVLLDAAMDADVGSNGVASLRYRIVGGNDEGKFELRTTANPSADAVYLYLATVAPLDRELMPSYRLNVSAEDGGQPPLRGYLLSAYFVSLDEGAPAGSRVLQVRATDADVGDNARLSYHLPEGETRFAIDPQTGVISTGVDRVSCPVTAGKLDERERQKHAGNKSCVLTVFARDHGSPRQDGRTYVTVNLLDNNDHDPQISFRVFGDASATDASVDENAEVNQVVAAISVVDGDEGPNGETDLRVVGGNELGHFRLQSSGDFYLLRVAGVLDRERVPLYNLTVVGTDRGTPMRAATAHLVVRVNDVNDHAPLFDRAEYSVSLSERSPPGSFVESLTATDADTGVNAEVFYAIEAGDDRRWFAIDRRSGLVTTARELDRELQDAVELKIRAHDGGPNRRFAYATLRVQLLDENDEAPAFATPGGQLDVTLSETSPPHTLVTIVAATDNDLAANGSITYALHPSVEMLYAGMFEIDAAYGKLTTRAALDRETTSLYHLKVIARDGGSPSLSSTLDISLHVVDVNDNPPTIYPAMYFYQVDDGLQPGEFNATIRASDPDNGKNARIRYGIIGGAEGRFAIDTSSGQIVNIRTLDVRQQARYEITVSATNSESLEGGVGGDPSTAMVVVFVRGRQQRERQGPTLHPTPPCRQTLQMLEDGSAGAYGGREVGRLPRLDGAKYSIVDGDPHGWFRVSPLQAVVSTSGMAAVDREISSSVDLLIVANTLANFTTCSIRVRIEDINDNAPIFAQPYVELKVPESFAVGLALFVTQATDADAGDNARVSYAIENNRDGLFGIDSAGGTLTLSRSLRGHAGRVLQLDIVATDGGEPALTARQRVLLSVIDVNDHTPTFDQATYETSLPELTPVNERFFTVHASDADIGDNGRVAYNISAGNEELRFGIFPDGQMFVRRPLDREQRELYELVVTASDNGTRSRNSSVSVVVHVLDDNDNAPRFEGYVGGGHNLSFHIMENLPPDSYVGTLTATDDDSGRNVELSFSLAAAHQSDFSVDTKSGVIRTLRTFDREQLVQTFGHGDLALEATVSDNGVPRLSATARVLVHIDDENDNAPAFTKPIYKASLSEATPLRAQVARVSATDPDAGANGLIHYALVGQHADAFSVDEQSGQIFLAARLDRERQAEFSLTVVASDAAPPTTRRSATATVRVSVLDENDCAPVFDLEGPANYTGGADVPENADVGVRIHQFAAADDDLGVNGEVTFSISTGNVKDTFRIDATSGVLSLHKALDYELHKLYTLNISASDGGSPRLTTTVPFVVRVTDVNDNAPVFPNGAIVRTLREGVPADTLVATVAASDRDAQQNARISYALSAQSPPTESMHFRIRSDNGALYTAREMDRELIDSYSLTIIATDYGTPPLSAKKAVTVLVEDVNDNAPRFISLSASALPAEAERGHKVDVVAATDPDAGANGRVGYELADGHGHQDLFHLDRSTGEILLSRQLPPPAELQVSYQLTVRAYDEAPLSQRRSTNATVTILATSAGSERPAPRFERTQYRGSVSENEPIGTPVLSVRALPAASGSELEYYLTAVDAGGAPQGRRFAVDPHTGLVETAEPLDREQEPGPYRLTVLVTDRRANPPATANVTVSA